MDQKKWQVPIKRVPTTVKVDRTVTWNNLYVTYEQTFFGQVQMIRYSNDGTKVGAVSSNQVLLHRIPAADGAVWNEQTSRPCHSLRFREDDKMVVQSIEQRVVVKSTETAFERQFSGHTREVRDAMFLTKQNIVSCSDDTSVRLWDLVTQSEIGHNAKHTDYVRTMAYYSSDVFFTGSYDHNVYMWDVRRGLVPSGPPMTPSTSAPIEQIEYIPDCFQLACSAGDVVTIYDTRHTAEPLHSISHHTKTVTALAYVPHRKVLLTGSLDNRVKFVSLKDGNYNVLAVKKFEQPVTALGVHGEGTEFAVGMATGKFQVLRVDDQLEKKEEQQDDEPQEISLGTEEVKMSSAEKKEAVFKKKMELVRHQLIGFNYGRALRTALFSRVPDVIVSTLEELHRRGALHVAISGHNDRTIVQLLRFAISFVDSPNFTDLMIVVLDLIFEIYGPVAGRSTFFHRELMGAHLRLGEILAAQQQLESCVGMMELVVNNDE